MLITLALLGIFLSNFADLYFLTLFGHWFANRGRRFAHNDFGTALTETDCSSIRFANLSTMSV